MEPDQTLTRAEAQVLLAYAERTYRSVTDVRRRLSRVALIVAVLVSILFVIALLEWLSTRAAVDDVEDRPLVEALGVEIPDPRPAVERAQLRVQAAFWGFASLVTAAAALLFLAFWALTRPSPPPNLAEEAERLASRE